MNTVMHWRTKRKIEAARERARHAAEVRWARDRARRDAAAMADGGSRMAEMKRGNRWFIGMRDNWDGSEAWIPFRSWADAKRRMEMVMRNLAVAPKAEGGKGVKGERGKA